MPEQFRELTHDERPQAYHVIGTVFSLDDSSIEAPGGHRDPEKDQDHLFGHWADGKVVSVVHLMRRTTHVPGGEWTFGAIAGVSTLKEYRGRGYSSRLMELAGETMHKDGVDIGLLLTGINPFYEKFGWYTVPRRMISAAIPSGLAPKVDVLDQVDWREIAPIYDAFNRNRPYATVRTPAYWEGWGTAGLRGSKWLLIRDGSALVAYAAVRKGKEEVEAREIGWLPNRPDAATALADELMALTGAWGLKSFGWALPDEPVFWNHVERSGATITRGTTNSLMAIPIRRSAEEVHALDPLFDQGSGLGVFWSADDF